MRIDSLENIKSVEKELSSLMCVQYGCYCAHVGALGALYLHIFIRFHKTVGFRFVKKLFPSVHISRWSGSMADFKDYCMFTGRYSYNTTSCKVLYDTFKEFSCSRL